ncbi:MAG TPA: hypothetical protein EYN67_01160 [Flavobacteriales bacterium]|nr:hypothetical protein [Flavobacteriales bacterium]
MTTENMQKFIDKNSTVKIVEGALLTPEGKCIITADDMRRSDRVKYRFVDGESLMVLRSDIDSAPKFTPDWDIK